MTWFSKIVHYVNERRYFYFWCKRILSIPLFWILMMCDRTLWRQRFFDPVIKTVPISTFSNHRSVATQIQRTLHGNVFFSDINLDVSGITHTNSRCYLICMIWIKEFLLFQLHLIITKQRSTMKWNNKINSINHIIIIYNNINKYSLFINFCDINCIIICIICIIIFCDINWIYD